MPATEFADASDQSHSTVLEWQPSDNTFDEIGQLERAWPAALVKADIGLLEVLWAEDYSLVTPDGTLVTRADCLAGLCDGEIKFEAFDADVIDVRLYLDDVVVSGRVAVKCARGLPDLNAASGYVAVYSRRDDRWQLVTTVVTRAR
jgi:hypothetical protein